MIHGKGGCALPDAASSPQEDQAMAAKSGKHQYLALPNWKLRFFEAGILVKMPEFDAYYIGSD
jgi:hypothetical protein